MRVFGITLAIFVVLAANIFLFLGVMIETTESGRIIGTNTGAWRAVFFFILLNMLLVTAITVRATFRAPGNPRWRMFWNAAELLWVFGAVFSLIAALQSADRSLGPEIRSIMAEQTAERRELLAKEAKQLMLLACHDQTEIKGCQLIKMATTIEGQRQVGNLFDLIEISELAKNSEISRDIGVRLRELDREWFSISEGEALERYEGQPLKLPDWLKAALLFAPWVLAFVFPLKLGRSIVAFRN